MGGQTFQTKGHVFDVYTALGLIMLYVVITQNNLNGENQGVSKVQGV